MRDEFIIRGLVDGRPTVARWSDGRLVSDVELVRRAEIVVALGELFAATDDPGFVVQAALDGGTMAALLTTMRAFTVVTSVEVPISRETSMGHDAVGGSDALRARATNDVYPGPPAGNDRRTVEKPAGAPPIGDR